MVNPIGNAAAEGVRGLRGAARLEEVVARDADRILAASTQLGVPNMELLGREVAAVARRDPAHAADLLAELGPRLDAADRQRLTQAVAGHVDAEAPVRTPAGDAADLGRQKAELALDLTQIGLSIAGIFDPTPISDGLDGLISVFRGDWLGAGISAVSMIPYLGDAAKLGKLPKFAAAIENAAQIARQDAKFLEHIRAPLERIREAVAAAPLDSLPGPAREALQRIGRSIDDALGGAHGAPYSATVRGAKVELPGIEVRSIDYLRRDRASYEALRAEFDSHVRKDFLVSLARDPQNAAALERAGLDAGALARIASGKVPPGWQVHHKLPLDDGGTNDFSNLVLIKNDPYHIGITNAQHRLTGDLAIGESARIEWPVVPGVVYPPIPGSP